MLVLAQPSEKISPNLQASRSQKLIENAFFFFDTCVGAYVLLEQSWLSFQFIPQIEPNSGFPWQT